MLELEKYKDVSADLNLLSGNIVDCIFQVHKELGPGYSEQIYEEALIVELQDRKIAYQRQKSFGVFYKGKELPTAFKPDLIIEDKILLELKAVEKIHPVHQAQIYAYLKGTSLPLGFLVNFNVPLIKDGINRFKNKYSETPVLRVNNSEVS